MPTGVYKRIKGRKYGMSGKRHSRKTIKKIRIKKLGSKYPNRKTPISFTKEHRKKMSDSHKKEKHWNWQGGITSKNTKVRRSKKYKQWSRSVLKRDSFTCQKYKTKGGYLIAHHIQNFSDHPKLRFILDNGITLSKNAHREFHKIYGKRNNTKKQLLEFINN